VVALTVGLGIMADAVARCPSAGCQLDPAKTSFIGVDLSQAIAAG
jgi:glycerol uptake facilitator-like aquaporin